MKMVKKDNKIVSYKNCISNVTLLIFHVIDLFISKTHKGSSKDSIQKAIQLLIEVEDSKNPLQDEEIVEELEIENNSFDG